MNFKYYTLLVFLLLIQLSCKNKIQSILNDKTETSIPGDFYENLEASDLNEEGIRLTKNGQYAKGMNAFLASLEIEPNNPTTLSNLGLNRFLNRDNKDAIKLYQKAFKISDSTYHIAAINMAHTYFYEEEYYKGIEIADYVIDNNNDENILSIAFVHRALNYFGNKDCARANMDLNYISANYKGVGNTDRHILDLQEKVKMCWEYN
ncbi:hypothetical protein KO500_08200 [Cellulophaga baltica]|uniref:tetratricopeptide repeat protein n=1 Tax=Cellulophaga TaxID=104264 RepID=UPI001C066341|nr:MULTISPECIES: hypothetical protein [Cellulophaga]MBU2996413.1 hypothetical protein [Cellulophaga baltica]MDO6767809.1 hypothetical protein [Cellulophaga sp. 1_MG-2023]